MEQVAVPRILKAAKDVFFTRTLSILKEASDLCFDKIKIYLVKLNVSLLKDISDDVDFCFKLAKEEMSDLRWVSKSGSVYLLL
ncbi:hypothetical protein CTI12_AA196180 [Artemisia annua]|uniref:Uncharacterized protein n=1 Tax=Artemisia annua TaxID=35608 RepID=A0A2U1P418_ARTAN|nr:hypothetical protein CTI12_AA196180 [Artemisia annua]